MIEKHWAHTCTARPLNEQTIALSTAHYPQCGKPRPTPSASMESAVEADGKLWSFLHDSLHEAHKKLNATGGGEVYYAALDSIAAKLEKDVNGRFIASLTAELAEAREQRDEAQRMAINNGQQALLLMEQRDSLRDECEGLREAVGHYEDALLAECPEGGEGATFVSWNEARKALSASGRGDKNDA